MSATEEQMSWIAGSGMDAATYINGLFSVSFVIYLVGNVMMDFYEWTKPIQKTEEGDSERGRSRILEDEEIERGGWSRRLFENFVGRFPGQGRRLDGTTTTSSTRGRGRDYESMPLTSGETRDSVDVRNGEEEGSSQESFEMGTRRTRREGTGETVFDLGEDDEEDHGDDGYWKEDQLSAERT